MEPLASNLVLSGGDTLRLDALLSNDQLRATRLVVLSACQSGLTDIRDAPEEALSLATGFLHAGAPGVVGSYWSIDDASPMFLMRQFYAGLARLPPAHALREAQLWLRSASHVELAALFREIARVRPATPHVRRLVAEAPFDAEAEADPDGRPFAHPVHWAAFGLCGA
jgi:CHAT domain-containing protein